MDEVGRFNAELSWGQDADLVFRIAYRHPRIGYIPEPLSIVNFKRPGSITEQHWFQIHPRRQFIEHHLELSGKYEQSEYFE